MTRTLFVFMLAVVISQSAKAQQVIVVQKLPVVSFDSRACNYQVYDAWKFSGVLLGTCKTFVRHNDTGEEGIERFNWNRNGGQFGVQYVVSGLSWVRGAYQGGVGYISWYTILSSEWLSRGAIGIGGIAVGKHWFGGGHGAPYGMIEWQLAHRLGFFVGLRFDSAISLNRLGVFTDDMEQFLEVGPTGGYDLELGIFTLRAQLMWNFHFDIGRKFISNAPGFVVAPLFRF